MSSDNVRQQPPLRTGVFGGISSELKSKTPEIPEVFSLIAVPSRGTKSLFLNILQYIYNVIY
jgi:hypothetical protein